MERARGLAATGAMVSQDEGSSPGMSRRTWARALLAANPELVPDGIAAVSRETGGGMAPARGVLPLAVRLALTLSARVVVIPPAPPWRHGRLERRHLSMERACWRREAPNRIPSAGQGLREWLTVHHLDRPHGGLAFKAPGDVHPWAGALPDEDWAKGHVPERLPSVAGLVEALRLVEGDGRAGLWGAGRMLAPALAGQYVRVRMRIAPGQEGRGAAVSKQRKGLEIEVAPFAHRLDQPSGRDRSARPLFQDVRRSEFAQPRRNEALDEHQPASQQSRTLTRRSRLDEQPAGGGAANGSAPA